VIRRFYVHNFRCLENFDLPVSGRPSVLLIGDNGAGKTTVLLALEILQKIARGTNRIRDLVTPSDFFCGHSEAPMRFEIVVELGAMLYGYTIAFEFPKGFRELRVFEEKLVVGGTTIYSRDRERVRFFGSGAQKKEAESVIDWHLVYLPIIQQQSADDPVSVFKQWLGRMLILRPIPSLILGRSESETLQPSKDVKDFGAWFTGLLAYAPSAYSQVDSYLKQVMPDFKDIKNPSTGADSRSLSVQFATDQGSLTLPFGELSDGEKCFMICALVVAANAAYGPLLCFWDEPDNFLAPSEVGHLVMALRRAFKASGQLITTSHNPEAIRRFSDENTLLLDRKSHLEPTVVRLIEDVGVNGDLVGALTRGDL
jgi:ABC-type multidrug transport system ATPase subunit